MIYKIFKTFFFLMFSLFSSLAAEDGAEKLFALEEETYHSTELSDFLENLRKHPLNINKIPKIDLQKFPWLSENDIEKIISFRKQTKILNWTQLRKTGINDITLREMQPYLKFAEIKNSHFLQVSRIELPEKDEHLPSSLKYLQKTIMQIGNFKFGFISQKDSGEKDLLDYYSYFAEYKSKHFLRQIILGNYRLAFGQGILFAPKLGMSKSAEAVTVPIKKYTEIRSYTSSYENWFLKGSVAKFSVANFYFIPFFSKIGLTANLSENGNITSFDETGIHFEDEKKNNVEEKIYGCEISKMFKTGKIGAVVSRSQFNRQFENRSISHDYFCGSTFYLFNYSAFAFFGENAFADNKFAAVNGFKWGKDKLRQLLLFRFYEKNFPTWHGNPFSSQSSFDNEIGLYFGTSFLPSDKMKLNIYFDLWKFPQTRYFEKMPTVGAEQFIQWELKSKKNSWRFTFQNKNREKYKSFEGDTKIRDLNRTLFRCDWWQFLSFAVLKTRMELVAEYLPENDFYQRGILAYEQFKIKKSKFEIIARTAVYHSQILLYMYENNVDGIMQNSIFSGDGIYSFLLLKYNLVRSVEIQFKIADNWFEKEKMKLYFQVVSKF